MSEKELNMALEEWIVYQREKTDELNTKYLPNPSHENCHIAYIMGDKNRKQLWTRGGE